MNNREEQRLDIIEGIHNLRDLLIDSCNNYSVIRNTYWYSTMIYEFSLISTKLSYLQIEFVETNNIDPLCIH